MSAPISIPPESEPRERKHWIELRDLNWPLVFLFYSLLGLITAGTVYTAGLAERSHPDYFYPLLWEITGHWTVFLLVPLIVLAFSRLPPRPHNWFWTVPLHVAISAVLGVLHTLMMYGTRSGLYYLLGLGQYDYGEWGYRFVMEYHKQFLNYWSVYLVLRVLAHFRHSRERERRTAALELKTAELQKQLTQAQLDVLRSQLNPHFLFNTLNMISSVMYDDVERADRMLSALSRMLRMSLEADVPPCVPVRRELEFIDCAIELAKARFEQKLDIQVNCAPSAANALIPNLLVYTLIENSIKHHDFELSPNIIVRADIRRQGNQLEIEVADNGPGIANLDQAIGRGVGLTNTRERLQALYTNRHQFALRNGPNGGLHARIEIPFEAATNGTPAVPQGAIATCAVDTAGV